MSKDIYRARRGKSGHNAPGACGGKPRKLAAAVLLAACLCVPVAAGAAQADGTAPVPGGIPDFPSGYESVAGGGEGGWRISGGKAVAGAPARRGGETVRGSAFQTVTDDNSFSGRLVVGDSRIVQLYEYGGHAHYSEASFVAVWGGHYLGESEVSDIDSPLRVGIMEAFVRESLEFAGSCDVYVEATVNDYGGGDGYEECAGRVLALAEALKGIRAERGGEEASPRVTVISLAGKLGSDVSAYNAYLEAEAAEAGISVLDVSGCLCGDNGGYAEDGIHFNSDTLSAIWDAILSRPRAGEGFPDAGIPGYALAFRPDGEAPAPFPVREGGEAAERAPRACGGGPEGDGGAGEDRTAAAVLLTGLASSALAAALACASNRPG